MLADWLGHRRFRRNPTVRRYPKAALSPCRNHIMIECNRVSAVGKIVRSVDDAAPGKDGDAGIGAFLSDRQHPTGDFASHAFE
jgi:hypothetical protein